MPGDARPAHRAPVSDQEFMADFSRFLERMSEQRIGLSDEQRDLLLLYGRFVHERSALLNLVGPADRARFFCRHVAESLHPRLIENLQVAGTMIDIGSGAGLPGIPLAIAVAASSVLLVEPRQRKAQFLEAAIQRLGLASRATVFQGTAEKLLRVRAGEVRASLVTARAVGRLATTWDWSLGMLIPGGWFATFKGPGEVAQEIESIPDSAHLLHETFPVHGEPRVLLLLQAPPG